MHIYLLLYQQMFTMQISEVWALQGNSVWSEEEVLRSFKVAVGSGRCPPEASWINEDPSRETCFLKDF